MRARSAPSPRATLNGNGCERVEREQHKVVHDRRADEPDRESDPDPGGHHPAHRVTGQGEAGEQGKQVQRVATVMRRDPPAARTEQMPEISAAMRGDCGDPPVQGVNRGW